MRLSPSSPSLFSRTIPARAWIVTFVHRHLKQQQKRLIVEFGGGHGGVALGLGCGRGTAGDAAMKDCGALEKGCSKAEQGYIKWFVIEK